MDYESFSSFPPEEEQQFVVFEERMREAEKKAITLGIGVAAGVFLLLVVIIVANWGPLKPIINDPEQKPATAQPR